MQISKDHPYNSYILLIEQNERYRKQNIILMLLLAIVIIVCMVESLFVIVNQPEPIYIELVEPKHLMARVIPPVSKATVSQKQEVYRHFLRQYIISRHSIDNVNEKIRLSSVTALSNEASLKQFKEEYDTFKATNPTVRREVEIQNDSFVKDENYYAVFETKDVNDKGKEVIREWSVSVKFRIDPNYQLALDELHLNPMGMRIEEYRVSAKK